MTKYLTKSNLREELNSLWFTVGGGVHSIMEGKACLQQKEATGHIPPAIRKKRTVKAGVQTTFSFSVNIAPQPGGGTTHI